MLSPLLFSVYVGEIVDMINQAKCQGVYVNENAPNLASLLFADDLAGVADSVGRLQKIIDVISNFCKKWGLKINLDKTKIMVFRNGGPLRQNKKWFLDGTQIEVINQYKYLGMIFTPKLIWTACQKTLAAQARKAVFLIRRYDHACNSMPVKTLWKLFDTLVTPILLYGAEIWGHTRSDYIESVQTTFCKYFLGVSARTPAIALLAETGRYPMYIKCYKQHIKYWLKILDMPDTRYPKACYQMLYQIDQQHRDTWVGSIRTLLCEHGFQDTWEAQYVENKEQFVQEFVNRVKNEYDRKWSYALSQSPKLSLYHMLKPDGICEAKYLDVLNLRPYRAGLARLRCSSHNLQIEVGRHEKQRVEERVCKLCLKERGRYVLEDEFHFVACCPSLDTLRNVHLPMLVDKSFDTFLNIMSSESEEIILCLASYIYQAGRLRTCLL